MNAPTHIVRAPVPPDNRPVKLLGELLAASRAAGASFDVAWEPAVAHVLANSRGQTGWATAFAETKRAWCDAYQRSQSTSPFAMLAD